MAFWCRINQSKVKHLTHQFKKCYSQIHVPSLLSYSASHTKTCLTKKPNWVIHRKPTDFCTTVRFFAAPVQAKPKKEEKDTSGPRLNDQIKAQVVRLVSDEGHCVVSRDEALARARKLELDLVEVQRHSDPPVCKIMDFHKERYKLQLKEKDRAKNKSELTLRKGECKEVRFKIHTEQKDLKMKADMVKRLMERGYRVKCTALGTEDQDLGGILSRLVVLIEDVSVVESGPRVETKQAYVIVRHIKYGPSKKGGEKKMKVVGALSPEVQNAAAAAESGLGTENENLSDEEDMHISSSEDMPNKNLEEGKTAWSVLDASDEFDEVFNFSDDVNGVTSKTTDKHMNAVPETASSPANTNISDFLHPRPVPDSMRGNTVPSSPHEPSLGTENRYKRSEPRNRFPATKSIDYKSPGARDSVRSEPQFSNQRQLPSDPNVSLSTEEIKPVGPDASEFRNLKLSKNEMPKQELSRPGTSSTLAPNYGIFSAPKANPPGKQGIPAVVLRNKEGNSSDFSQNPNPGGVSENPNFPSLKSDSSQKPGLDKGGQGGWGIFSRESSNVIPNRISENQAKVQR